jgi:hypothetical protein
MNADAAAVRSIARNAELNVPRDEDGPVFREPWEAEAFALAVSLNERGLFTWKEWAKILGEEIKKAQASSSSRWIGSSGQPRFRKAPASLKIAN